MATVAPDALRWLAREWESGIDSAQRRNDAATFSGIVGDLAHRASGGYHISREDQPASNYSIADFSDDREGRSDWASAVDMTMDRESMILVTKRLAAAWAVRDPRLDAVRGFNGTLDGTSARRWDAAYDTPTATTWSDDTHLWHIHLEIFRRFADDMSVMPGILAVVLGHGVEGVDELATASDKINAWMVGATKTSDNELVAPTVWRQRDESWQAAVNQRLTDLTAKVDAVASKPTAVVDLGDGGREALAELTAKVDRIVAALDAAGAGLGKADGK